jgi:GNAT superfamily N-acetyltransferase
MTLQAPQALQTQHDLAAFDCGKPNLNAWLQRHARQAQGSGSAKVFVMADALLQVVAFYALTVGQIDTLDAPDRIRQGMGCHPIPVVVLARLAVTTAAQGQGLGVALLQDAIRRTVQVSEQVGIRALLTHPIDDDAAGFYRRFGFVASPVREGQLLLLLKDARRWV